MSSSLFTASSGRSPDPTVTQEDTGRPAGPQPLRCSPDDYALVLFGIEHFGEGEICNCKEVPGETGHTRSWARPCWGSQTSQGMGRGHLCLAEQPILPDPTLGECSPQVSPPRSDPQWPPAHGAVARLRERLPGSPPPPTTHG